MGGILDVATGGELLEDIAKAWRDWGSLGNREGESVSLTFAVVGVLSEDDYLDLREWGELESVVDFILWGIDFLGLVFKEAFNLFSLGGVLEGGN